jgi:hypothetical protein
MTTKLPYDPGHADIAFFTWVENPTPMTKPYTDSEGENRWNYEQVHAAFVAGVQWASESKQSFTHGVRVPPPNVPLPPSNRAAEFAKALWIEYLNDEDANAEQYFARAFDAGWDARKDAEQAKGPVEITDEMVERYDEGYASCAEGTEDDRIRCGLEAAING